MIAELCGGRIIRSLTTFWGNATFATALTLSAGMVTSAASAQDYSFSYTGSIVEWTVPATGTYSVTAIGAQGAAADTDYIGGRGAQVTGEFTFTAGDVLQIAVGGAGTAPGGSGGGGGGTFLVTSDDEPLLIAGGGGGTRENVAQNGTDASITTQGWSASGYATTYTPVYEASDGEGGAASSSSWGSGGAGFYSDGEADGSYGTGGSSWANGLAGGTSNGCTGSVGGFGGGGSGDGCWGGGGGGGYSGGAGGRVAGGGGSYNAGSNQSATAGVGYGNGSLTISALETSNDESETTALIASFMTQRGQLIVNNGPDISRRIGRLKGELRTGGGISGFGASYSNNSLPITAQVSRNSASFSYSSRQTAGGTGSVSVAMPGVGSSDALLSADNTATQDSNGKIVLSTSNATVMTESVEGTEGNVDALQPAATLSPWEVWSEATFINMDGTDTTGEFAILHFGADYLVNSNLLLGFGAQYDHTSMKDSDGAKVSGDGFMVGPYMTARLRDRLYFDARVAWGKSDNHISPYGTYTDAFTGERWLASAALIGDYEVEGISIMPETRLSWYQETSDAYTDSNDTDIPSVKTSFGTLEVGPTFTRDYALEDGASFKASFAPSLIYTFGLNGTADSTSLDEGTTARVEFSGDYMTRKNLGINGSFFVDGLGGSALHSWGFSLGLSASF